MKNKDTFSIKKTFLLAGLFILASTVISMLGYTIIDVISTINKDGFDTKELTIALLHLSPQYLWSYVVIFGIPAGLTLFNLYTLFVYKRINNWAYRAIELLSIIVGGFYTIAYLATIEGVDFKASYNTQLYDFAVHPPISPDHFLGLLIAVAIIFIGYIILTKTKADRTPPLVTALSLATLYLGAIICVIFTVQVILKAWPAVIFPINFIFIVLKILLIKINEYKQKEPFIYKNKFVAFIDEVLRKSYGLPAISIICLAPLLAVFVIILILFNQQPDSIIKLFTETSEWQLSQHVAPPNIIRPNGHYLCTVAANGHKNIVKPLRYGKRHGEKIIVNRQLLVANAFEQILEEKIPKVHKAVRTFYDKHGFPLSKLIKTKLSADVIYIIMKPLEWFFVAFIYLFDANPETRIAKQYLGTNDFTVSK